MDCTQVREELSALIDGELSPETRAGVEAHLAQCPDCLREAEDLKRLDSTYRALPPLAAPEGFEQAVAESLQSRPVTLARPSATRKPLWSLLALAATLVAVSGAVLFYLKPQAERMELARNSVLTVAPPEVSDRLVTESAMPVQQEHAEMDAATNAPQEKAQEVAPSAPAALAAPAPALAPPPPPTAAAAPQRAEVAKKVPAAPKPAQKEKRMVAQTPPSVEQKSESAPVNLPAPAVGGGMPNASASKTTEMPATTEETYAPTFAASDAAAASTKPDAKPKAKAPVSPQEAAELAAVSAPGKPGETRVVSGCTFEFRDGLWRQKGYSGEACTRLPRDSETLRSFLASHPDARRVCELRPGVLFKSGNAWYKLQ